MDDPPNRTLRFLVEEDAAAITHYAVVLALVVVVIVETVSGLGHKVNDVVTSFNNGLSHVHVSR